jgi:hypothetical protein
MANGNPWFSSSKEPGSSGNSGVDDTEAERGRLGSGFSRDADVVMTVSSGDSSGIGAGERSISFKAAWRLLAAFSSAAFLGVERGVKTYCVSSDGMILRVDGRRRLAFGVV